MNQKGFGLLETVISVGLLSVVTYGIISQSDLLGTIKGNAEFDEKVSLITSSVKTALGDKNTCTDFVSGVTIGKISGQQGTISSSSTGLSTQGEIKYKSIYHPYRTIPGTNDITASGGGQSPSLNYAKEPVLVWDAVHNKFKTQNGVEIKKVQLVTDGFRILLRLTYEKPSLFNMGDFGAITVIKDLIIRGTPAPNQSTLLSCNGDYKISDQQFCEVSSGGEWNSNTQKCIYPGYFKTDPGANKTQNLYLVNGKMVTSKLVVSYTAKCNCPKDSCLCKCNPQCSGNTIPENPPRFVVSGADFLFPIVEIFGPQKCSFERECYTSAPLPSGLTPVGSLIR